MADDNNDAPPKPPPRTLRLPPTALAPSPARLASLIAAWAPILRLHPTDAFHPCSGPWFAARSTLMDPRRGDGGKVLAPVGNATVPAAVAASPAAAASHPHDPVGAARAVRLALDVTARHGQPLAELNASVPLYVRAQLALPQNGAGRPTLELAYVALYAFNGPYHPLGEGWGGPALGTHDGDWERTTVRLDAESGELLGVWFNCHRPRDGSWAGVGGVEIDSLTGRPIAYVARHGHGTYSSPGVHPRAWGFANDHCSASGPVWSPSSVVLLAADRQELHPSGKAASGVPPELGFVECRGCEVVDGSCEEVRGRSPRSSHADVRVMPDTHQVGLFPGMWGETAAPRSQGWWARAECPVSRGLVKRLFLEGWPEA